MRPTLHPGDDELMARFAAGDVGAFEELFERHRAPLYTLLVEQTGDPSLADDVFQDVFLRVVKQRGSYRPGGSFRAWLFTIGRNAMNDHRRRARVREDEGATAASEAMPEPSGRLEADEVRGRIEQALGALPAEQREVFLLRERAELDFASIAEVCGCGLATARSRMRYALAALRRSLHGEPTLAEPSHD